MRLKPKFRPNLGEAANRGSNASRSRKTSGSEASAAVPNLPPADPAPAPIPAPTPPGSPVRAAPSKRCRTASGSSNASLNGEKSADVGETATTPTMPPKSLVQQPSTSLGMASPPPARSRNASGARSGVDSVLSSPGRCVGLMSPPRPIHRQRRLTESSTKSGGQEVLSSLPPSVYDKRKADHKKKFHSGVPERDKMTMFDLIYYNPTEGSRMSNSNSRRESRTSSVCEETEEQVVPDRLEAVRERLEEEAVDDAATPAGGSNRTPEEEEEEDDVVDEKLPVPQVKVGPNGEIIVDEESTVIETSAVKRAKEDLLETPLVVENSNQATSYGFWGKRKKNVDWSTKETLRFYKALSVFGTDFSMMEGVFKRRSRHDLKMKFKREERQNRSLVDKCLREGMQFDASVFESESDEEENTVQANKQKKKPTRKRSADSVAAARKKRKAQPKRRKYYSSSDDADAEESGQGSETETKRVSAAKENGNVLPPMGSPEKQAVAVVVPAAVPEPSKSPEVPEPEPETKAAAPSPVRRRRLVAKPNLAVQRKNANNGEKEKEEASLLKNLLTKIDEPSAPAAKPAHPAPAFASAFPPGLLAANPGLANAVPGSLVVVASPAVETADSSTAHHQTLHVYMVGETDKSAGDKKTSPAPPVS